MVYAIINRCHRKPRLWAPATKSPACISWSTRNGHAHTSRPGRLATVSASTWPCRPNSCLTRAALSCALVIPRALFLTSRVPALPSHPRAQSGAPREAVAEYVSL